VGTLWLYSYQFRSAASVIGLFLFAAHSLATEDRERSYFFEFKGGAEYDSVVSIDELDLSEDEGDGALLFDASAGFKQPFGDDVELDLNYRYSALDYNDISEADQRSHILSGDLKKDIGGADIGVTAFYIDSTLDNDGFLELTRFSPYISGFVKKGWFSRAAFVYSDKTNALNPERDATAAIGEVDLYHFPAGKSWYFNIGYKYRDEDASAARFDYAANTFKARWVQRAELWDRDARFELSFRHIDRDYSSITPSIGGERRDRRNRTQAKLELLLTQRVALELFYTYSDWDSNLESVDFAQNVGGFRLRYRWES
jgi:hypothetical protein